jgi:hypothetical protein
MCNSPNPAFIGGPIAETLFALYFRDDDPPHTKDTYTARTLCMHAHTYSHAVLISHHTAAFIGGPIAETLFALYFRDDDPPPTMDTYTVSGLPEGTGLHIIAETGQLFGMPSGTDVATCGGSGDGSGGRCIDACFRQHSVTLRHTLTLIFFLFLPRTTRMCH